MDSVEYIAKLRYSHNGLSTMRTLHDSDWLVRRFKLAERIKCHEECVNTICWADESYWSHILSAGDDRNLIVTDVETGAEILKVPTIHPDNIFCARFLYKSSDLKVVSCSSDGLICYTDLNRPTETSSCNFSCCAGGRGPVYELRCFPMCTNVFLSCSEDGTVRLYDLRIATSCSPQSNTGVRTRSSQQWRQIQPQQTAPLLLTSQAYGQQQQQQHQCFKHILIDCQVAVNSMDICPTRHHELAVGCCDGVVRLYDIRKPKHPFAMSKAPAARRQQMNSFSRRPPKIR